jgi:hypothetical protein
VKKAKAKEAQEKERPGREDCRADECGQEPEE